MENSLIILMHNQTIGIVTNQACISSKAMVFWKMLKIKCGGPGMWLSGPVWHMWGCEFYFWYKKEKKNQVWERFYFLPSPSIFFLSHSDIEDWTQYFCTELHPRPLLTLRQSLTELLNCPWAQISESPASPSLSAGIIGMHHHAQLAGFHNFREAVTGLQSQEWATVNLSLSLDTWVFSIEMS